MKTNLQIEKIEDFVLKCPASFFLFLIQRSTSVSNDLRDWIRNHRVQRLFTIFS